MQYSLEDDFYNFLNESRGLPERLQEVADANKETFFIDLDDVRDASSQLFTEIHKDFIHKHELLNGIFKSYCLKNIERPLEVGFKNSGNRLKIRELRSDVLGDLVSFSGTVTRTTQVRPELHAGVFICRDCKSVIRDVRQEYKYTEPLFCPNHLCTNRRRFEVDLSESQFSNWQRIHVQENTEEVPNGCLPRSIDVVVRNELCEQIKPGASHIFTGYLVVVPDAVQVKLPSQKSVVAADGVADEKQKRSTGSKEMSYKLCFFCIYADIYIENDGFTNDELAVVRRMLSTPDLYNKLSESLFPTIHGHSNIKSAILLMLVGGVSKTKDIRLRGDINILLVGDPGTAKSQFLKQTSALNPRSIYTSGKSSSAAGLTAAVVKDGETGEFTIEAGALMLSDLGVCCIDEFDKMTYKDQVSIHEAMEQQTITISKAGINATLNSRTSILAAANPIRGRYDKRKTLRQNVNLSAPIMSRFDLYFVLIDDPEPENDRNISRHILQNHLVYNGSDRFGSGHSPDTSLSSSVLRPFSVEEVKLFIRYVKDKMPVLTAESKKELIDKYVLLRQDSLVNTNNYRMTVRHLESLIRLSEALAKIHNESEVSPQYILEAFRLLKSSLVEIKSEDVVLTAVDSLESYSLPGKDLAKITNTLIYLLKSGTNIGKDELVSRYLLLVEESLGTIAVYENEKLKCEKVIDFLIGHEGVLFEMDGVVHIHPNYDY
ncbi:uncharacterized protein VICG_01603 [Vittaforma corneae ATCC 50505]|uniref:DNA replication licensing factor MCM6 n=1 Tax=Vittaforma corneae (strain ATCC 50505) TaxID=993615 RepID=L2GM36_VITCO|nr:uncharacterized protein VICG_01603 [Vittaforma corneae ATCC 50505]ELA41362.1 hypothetical protein VICG_01603 [Vittaforma corneae ATCC 50505]